MARAFTKGTPLYEIEAMMTQIPNFEPRYSGLHIYKRMKDPEAGKCKYCADTKKRIGCIHPHCPYIFERAKMGSINYAELISTAFITAKGIPRFEKRLNSLGANLNGEMFLNKEHEYRYYDVIKKIKQRHHAPSNKYCSAIYLLTTSSNLWQVAEEHTYTDVVDFKNIKLKGMTIDSYTYYQTARTLYDNILKIKISEICDREIVSDEAFKIIIHATLIKIYGAEILKL